MLASTGPVRTARMRRSGRATGTNAVVAVGRTARQARTSTPKSRARTVPQSSRSPDTWQLGVHLISVRWRRAEALSGPTFLRAPDRHGPRARATRYAAV